MTTLPSSVARICRERTNLNLFSRSFQLKHIQHWRSRTQCRFCILMLKHFRLRCQHRPYLLSGLGKRHGIQQVMLLYSTPGSSVVCYRPTRLHIFIVQYVTMVTHDATAGEFTIVSTRSSTHHLTVQCHHCRQTWTGTRWTAATSRRTSLRGEATVHLPAVSRCWDQTRESRCCHTATKALTELHFSI